jgi:hypothetical protein
MAYAVHLLMRQVVNCDLQFNADFWAWYIDPVLLEKGWEPHRDRQTMPFNDRGEPTYVTGALNNVSYMSQRSESYCRTGY